MSGEEVEALRTKLAKKEEANQKLKANLVGAAGSLAAPPAGYWPQLSGDRPAGCRSARHPSRLLSCPPQPRRRC